MSPYEFNLIMGEHTLALRQSALFTNDEEDAHDLMQDTILKAMSYYRKFEEGSNIRGWLFVIMKNTFINNYRRNGKFRSIVIQDDKILRSNLILSFTNNTAEDSFAMADITRALVHFQRQYPSTLRILLQSFFTCFSGIALAIENGEMSA